MNPNAVNPPRWVATSTISGNTTSITDNTTNNPTAIFYDNTNPPPIPDPTAAPSSTAPEPAVEPKDNPMARSRTLNDKLVKLEEFHKAGPGHRLDGIERIRPLLDGVLDPEDGLLEELAQERFNATEEIVRESSNWRDSASLEIEGSNREFNLTGDNGLVSVRFRLFMALRELQQLIVRAALSGGGTSTLPHLLETERVLLRQYDAYNKISLLEQSEDRPEDSRLLFGTILNNNWRSTLATLFRDAGLQDDLLPQKCSSCDSVVYARDRRYFDTPIDDITWGCDECVVSCEFCGKVTLTYIGNEQQVWWQNNLGNVCGDCSNRCAHQGCDGRALSNDFDGNFETYFCEDCDGFLCPDHRQAHEHTCRTCNADFTYRQLNYCQKCNPPRWVCETCYPSHEAAHMPQAAFDLDSLEGAA